MVWTAFRLWHGVGLVFWGVAEPLTHYLNPVGVESATPEAADFAMKSFFMHWGDSSVGELCCDRSGSGLLYVSEEQERFSQQYPGTVIRRKNDKRMAGKTCGYSGGFLLPWQVS